MEPEYYRQTVPEFFHQTLELPTMFRCGMHQVFQPPPICMICPEVWGLVPQLPFPPLMLLEPHRLEEVLPCMEEHGLLQQHHKTVLPLAIPIRELLM